MHFQVHPRSCNCLLIKALQGSSHTDVLLHCGLKVRGKDVLIVTMSHLNASGATDDLVAEARKVRGVTAKRHGGAFKARQRHVPRRHVSPTGRDC